MDGTQKELSIQYSTIALDSHFAQAFAQLEQGLDELLDMYLHCTSELLSKFTIHQICLGFEWKV